jgi:hypothetical protein
VIGADDVDVVGTSVLDLPDHLSAKADPGLIAGDERHLAAIVESLEQAYADLSDRLNGVPVVHGSTSELGTILDAWLAAHAEGIACAIGDPTFASTSRGRSLTPELSKGLEFDLVVLVDPEAFGGGIEGAVDCYVAMTRATQQLVALESPR